MRRNKGGNEGIKEDMERNEIYLKSFFLYHFFLFEKQLFFLLNKKKRIRQGSERLCGKKSK